MQNVKWFKGSFISLFVAGVGVAQASWSEVLYTITEQFSLEDRLLGFTATENKSYSWDFVVANRDAVTGSDATAPWRADFATKFDTTTWVSGTFTNVFLFAGQRVTNVEIYNLKSGRNTWADAGGNVMRDLFKHTTTSTSYRLDWGDE